MTLKVVGMTVVIWTFWLPDRVAVVTVAELVVAEREMEGVVAVGVEPEEVVDWAEIRARRNEAVMTSRRILLGHITRVERGRSSGEKQMKRKKPGKRQEGVDHTDSDALILTCSQP